MASNRNIRWEKIDKSKNRPLGVMQHFEVHNKAERKSPRTVGWYNEVLGMFIKWLREDGSSTAIGDIDENMVRRFILHIQEKPGIKGPVSTHTVANRVRALTRPLMSPHPTCSKFALNWKIRGSIIPIFPEDEVVSLNQLTAVSGLESI